MLGHEPFYHSHIRQALVAFGSIFSDIKVRRQTRDADGNLTNTADDQTIKIPFTFSPKEKWLARLRQSPERGDYLYARLPVLGCEMIGYNYDPERKLPKTQRVSIDTVSDNGFDQRKSTYTPVPYNLSMQLYIISKGLEDSIQIVEQILPFFTPDFTLRIKTNPFQNSNETIEKDLPFVLHSTSVQDEWEGDISLKRIVTHTFGFTIKLDLFGPATDANIVYNVNVGIDTNLDTFMNYEIDQSIYKKYIIGEGIINEAGQVTGIEIGYFRGSGFTNEDIVKFEGGGGKDAKAELVMVGGDGRVNQININITNPGSEYTSQPLIVIERRS